MGVPEPSVIQISSQDLQSYQTIPQAIMWPPSHQGTDGYRHHPCALCNTVDSFGTLSPVARKLLYAKYHDLTAYHDGDIPEIEEA